MDKKYVIYLSIAGAIGSLIVSIIRGVIGFNIGTIIRGGIIGLLLGITIAYLKKE